jgi:hypothetical protein
MATIIVTNTAMSAAGALAASPPADGLFAYASAPTVTSAVNAAQFSLAAGYPGETLAIGGTNFYGDLVVGFGGVAVPATVNSVTSLTVVVPSGPDAGTAVGLVVSSAEGASAPVTFTYFGPPRITALSSSKALSGLRITISGVNFGAATAVAFAGVPAQVTVSSATSLIATVPPPPAGPVKKVAITTSTAAGSSTNIDFPFDFLQNTVFGYTGGNQQFVVPSGVTEIFALVAGAGSVLKTGNGNRVFNADGDLIAINDYDPQYPPQTFERTTVYSYGALVNCKINVTPGQVLNIVCGQQGSRAIRVLSYIPFPYGYGGGGGAQWNFGTLWRPDSADVYNLLLPEYVSSSGGGFSGIFDSTASLSVLGIPANAASTTVIAGGAGGSTAEWGALESIYVGGDGNYPEGSATIPGGGGGTQTRGGASMMGGSDGRQFIGGLCKTDNSVFTGGPGGGGGYYGGGGTGLGSISVLPQITVPAGLQWLITSNPTINQPSMRIDGSWSPPQGVQTAFNIFNTVTSLIPTDLGGAADFSVIGPGDTVPYSNNIVLQDFLPSGAGGGSSFIDSAAVDKTVVRINCSNPGHGYIVLQY